MPKIFNLYGDPDWDRTEDRPGWKSKDARVGRHIGGELLGASMYELEPGDKLWPYHTHFVNEEWLLVVGGELTLRTPEGENVLQEGDVVAFPRGEEGYHQVINRTEAPIRVLMLSSMNTPELLHYPDSDKWAADNVKGEDVFLARLGPMLEYWDGEE